MSGMLWPVCQPCQDLVIDANGVPVYRPSEATSLTSNAS